MKTCSIEGCNRKYIAKGYCSAHYNRYRSHGERFNKSPYVNTNLNEIIILENYAIMKLYTNYGDIAGETKIDIEDIEKVWPFKWSLMKCKTGRYVCNAKKGLLHRFILEKEKTGAAYTDHINMDILDNRKTNLRDCTNSENMSNSGLHTNNTSGYKGVSWSNKYNKWRAYIKKDYKFINLGQHDSKELAALAYNNAALEYHGEFARVNQL